MADVVEQVLSEHQLALAEVGDAEQEDVRPRAARETSRLCVEEEDILPALRCFALQTEVCEQHRIRRSVADDLQSEIAGRDPLLDDLERRRGRCRPRALGRHRDHLPVTGTISLDDRSHAGAKVVQASDKRCATDSRTSVPSAYAGPTQDGHPDPHPQDSRCSFARWISGWYELNRRSEKPMPPGVMSNR